MPLSKRRTTHDEEDCHQGHRQQDRHQVRTCQTKIDKVIKLLKRKDGATLDQMVKATGWQPHTTRAAMTGLRKKGHTIDREAVDGTSRYRITASA